MLYFVGIRSVPWFKSNRFSESSALLYCVTGEKSFPFQFRKRQRYYQIRSGETLCFDNLGNFTWSDGKLDLWRPNWEIGDSPKKKVTLCLKWVLCTNKENLREKYTNNEIDGFISRFLTISESLHLVCLLWKQKNIVKGFENNSLGQVILRSKTNRNQ